MSKASEELVESAARFARAIGVAAAREGPAMRRAAGRIVREDLPGWRRAAERAARQAVADLRARSR